MSLALDAAVRRFFANVAMCTLRRPARWFLALDLLDCVRVRVVVGPLWLSLVMWASHFTGKQGSGTFFRLGAEVFPHEPNAPVHGEVPTLENQRWLAIICGCCKYDHVSPHSVSAHDRSPLVLLWLEASRQGDGLVAFVERPLLA